MVRFVHAELAPAPFEPAAWQARLAGACPGAGALLAFVGTVRPHGTDGTPLGRLFLDHHPRLTLPSLQTIAGEAQARFDLLGIVVVHRCGAVAPGEPIVLVAAAAPHRRAAFEAVDQTVDRLKCEAVFWKREDTAAGSRWVEPTSADHADLARWTNEAA